VARILRSLLRCLDVEALNHTIFFTIFRARPKFAPEMFLADPRLSGFSIDLIWSC
jgi:hypothetical protein